MTARFLNLWMNPFIVLLKSLPIFRYVLKTWWAEFELRAAQTKYAHRTKHLGRSAARSRSSCARRPASSTVYRRGKTPTRLGSGCLLRVPPVPPPVQSPSRAGEGLAEGPATRRIEDCGFVAPPRLSLFRAPEDAPNRQNRAGTRRRKASVFFSRARLLGEDMSLLEVWFCYLPPKKNNWEFETIV